MRSIQFPSLYKSLRALSLLSLSLLSTASLSAEDLSEIPENGWEDLTGLSTPKAQVKYTPSTTKKARTRPRDLFLISGGAVYLRPYQGGTDFGQLVNSADLSSGAPPYGTNKALDFDFDWGFRGNIGYQCGKSRQTLGLTYLYLNSEASKTTTGGATTEIYVSFLEETVPGGFPIGTGVHSAHSHWNLHFNMLDLTLGKKYPRTKCMHFEPFIGIKGILLSENQTSSYLLFVGATPGKLKQKVDFKGIGALGGLNLDWVMTRWLSFTGTIDAALLYSSIETTRSSDKVLGSLFWIGKSHDIKGTPVLEGTFALRAVYCCNKGGYIDLKVGFEEHYLFQVMKHSLFNADAPTDLSLMGWFATLGLAF